MDEGAGPQKTPGPGDAAGGGPGSGTTHKSLWKSLKGRLSSGGDRRRQADTRRRQADTRWRQAETGVQVSVTCITRAGSSLTDTQTESLQFQDMWERKTTAKNGACFSL